MTGLRSRLAYRLPGSAVAVAGLVIAAVGFAPGHRAEADSATSPYLDGTSTTCEDWRIQILNLGIGSVDFSFPDEGWVWVDSSRRLQSASGVATKSKVAHNDTPANHYSHDWNVDIRVDPGQEYLLSYANGHDISSNVPQKIEMEWETGILPTQTSGDDDDPWFPAWVTPSIGDRVWTNGHWIYDCGHSTDGRNPSEIHPGRAIAAMRSQTALVPGSGTTPVPVTATDLYVHGRGGYNVQQLTCGMNILLDGDSCPTTTTDIADIYEFDVCLPTKPAPQALLAWSVESAPGNTLDVPPQIARVTAAGGCLAPLDEFGNDFDDATMLHVVADLANSGASPEDVYARHITAGWVFPTTALRHLQVRLDQMDLHEDHEGPGFNGEMSFLWMNVDRARSDEWHRLAHFDLPTYDDGGKACFGFHNTLNNYDDDQSCGQGLLNFSGPTYDFYAVPGQNFSVHARGFEQDCYDENFGDGEITSLEYAECHGGDPTEIEDWGNNEKIADLDITYPPDLEPGRYEPSGLDSSWEREYELEFELTDLPLTDEDTADLAVAKDCTYPGEVALAGQPFTCTVTVTNNGPGLPRNVVISDTPTTMLAREHYTIGEPTAVVGPESAPVACSKFRETTKFSCFVGTIPVGSSATMTVAITPLLPGRFDNVAVVTTDSTDAVVTNNSASDFVVAYLPVEVDVQPTGEFSALNTDRRGTLPVAVITTPRFDALSLDVLTICFGDAEAPLERDCTESHGRGHPTDVDRDRDLDLSLHYAVVETGIDPMDTTACLIGRTRDGTGVYGCDTIRTI